MGKKKKNSEESIIPDWVGNYPFPPDKKKPVVMNREKSILFVYGKGLHKVSCTTAISTNHIQTGIMIISPGEYFEPPDIHSGDEVYYVLEGEGAVLNPETGRAFKAREGEVVLIPKGIWHQTFNTGDKNLEVLAFIAPLQWKKGEAHIPSEFTGESAYYKGSSKSIKGLGRWPNPSKAKNVDDEISIIRDRETLGLIHGSDNHFLVSFYVSNSRLHVGKLSIPARLSSGLESHQGDEIIYMERGHLGIEIHEGMKVKEATVQDIFEVKEDEFFLIPEGMKHRYFNFSDQLMKIMFGVAPRL